MAKWIGDRISTEDHEKSVTIVIFPLKTKWKEALLFAWILGFTFVGVTMLYLLINGVELLNAPEGTTQEELDSQRIYLIIFLGFWSYFEYKTVRSWMWYRFGKELLKIDTEGLTVKKSLFSYGKANKYLFENIKKFGERKSDNTSFGQFFENSYWSLGMDTIGFEYFGKSRTFGRRLDEKSARLLIRFIDDRIKKMMKRR